MVDGNHRILFAKDRLKCSSKQCHITAYFTHGLRYTTGPFAIPVVRSLAVKGLTVSIERERAAAAGSANLEERAGPVTAFALIKYIG